MVYSDMLRLDLEGSLFISWEHSVLLSMLKSQILIGKINEKKGKTIRIYELAEQTIKGSNGSLPGWASHQDWIPFNQIQVLRHKI